MGMIRLFSPAKRPSPSGQNPQRSRERGGVFCLFSPKKCPKAFALRQPLLQNWELYPLPLWRRAGGKDKIKDKISEQALCLPPLSSSLSEASYLRRRRTGISVPSPKDLYLSFFPESPPKG